MRRWRWFGLGVAALGLGAALVDAERIVGAVITPDVAFDEDDLPAPPDYAAPAAWSALPGRADPADARPDRVDAPADVFYVHPTSYLGAHWLGDALEPSLAADTDRVATRIQASAFDACCAVYAPRYRQANGSAFFAPGPDGARALDAAVSDVVRAFEAFEARRGADRPFLLVGHSQGAVVAARLLRERIATSAARDRLVAAWLLGAPLLPADVGVPVCERPDATGCVISYNARSHDATDGMFQIVDPRPGERICVNPLTWRPGGPAPASANRGAVFVEFDPFVEIPAFAGAGCEAGVLRVTDVGVAPRDLPSRILDALMGAGNYHPIEVQMFYENLRENAGVRVEAWRRAPAAN